MAIVPSGDTVPRGVTSLTSTAICQQLPRGARNWSQWMALMTLAPNKCPPSLPPPSLQYLNPLKIKMPLFTDHNTMKIDVYQNHSKWYTICYNESHGHHFKFWDLGTTTAPPAAWVNTPPPAQNSIPPAAQSSSNHPRPARTPSTKCSSCPCPGNTQRKCCCCRTHCHTQPSSFCSVHEVVPLARTLSNTKLQILVAGLKEAATALPASHRHMSEFHHQCLTQEQEAAVCLAALTLLPSLPTPSQEACNWVFAISIALGTSPPLLIMSQPTRCVTLISWTHSTEVSTTPVQDLPSWAQMWPMIHLANFAPFLTSYIHPHPDPYYDYWNFQLGQWVSIPQVYTFYILTDEPILLLCSGMVANEANDQDDLMASFTRFVDRFLYRVELPAALSCKCQHTTTPASQHPSKNIKPKVTNSSSDELEISEVCHMVKLEPHTPPTSHLSSAPGPLFSCSHLSFPIPMTIASGSCQHLFSPSPPPITSTSHLPPLLFMSCCISSLSLLLSTPSLYNITFTTFSSSLSLSSPGSSSSNPIHFPKDK
ncbi:hypothetical protein DFH08DRAFT_815969 [Mycena albidolilacea]|uniref:Uncharacterized protein n=1 Tax=Mycena albidolilacea TaxID=1033008 RepID=A0AAD6ZM43_9AGAR|nr:hypothetical protein DFH08DRAFT_815969 [Mycena albidolilacea]